MEEELFASICFGAALKVNDMGLHFIHGLLGIELNVEDRNKKNILRCLADAVANSMMNLPVSEKALVGRKFASHTNGNRAMPEIGYEMLNESLAYSMGFRSQDISMTNVKSLQSLLSNAASHGHRVNTGLNDILFWAACGSGMVEGATERTNTLLALLRQHVFPVMKKLPFRSLNLSVEGWRYYLMLDTTALARWLQEMLAENQKNATHASNLDHFSSVLSSTESIHRKIAEAIVLSPGLHLLCRRYLRQWLAMSGNGKAWDLMYSLLRLTNKLASTDPKGCYPVECQSNRPSTALFPAFMRNMAELVQALDDDASKVSIPNSFSWRLESLLEQADKVSDKYDRAGLEELLWQLVLDAPNISKWALRSLSFNQLSEKHQKLRLPLSHGMQQGTQVTNRDDVLSASRWLGRLTWPGDPSKRIFVSRFLSKCQQHHLEAQELLDSHKSKILVDATFSSLHCWHNLIVSMS